MAVSSRIRNDNPTAHSKGLNISIPQPMLMSLMVLSKDITLLLQTSVVLHWKIFHQVFGRRPMAGPLTFAIDFLTRLSKGKRRLMFSTTASHPSSIFTQSDLHPLFI